jgi:predicted dehydrogenase
VLDANDSFVSTLKLAGGAVGVVHATRWAAGHVNSLSVRVFGDRGAVEVDLDRSVTTYRLARSKKPMRQASWKDVTAAKTPTQYQRFVAAVRSGVSDESDFVNGARIQACLDASFLSDKRRRPVIVTA